MTITITALHPSDAYYPDREDFIGLQVEPERIESCGDEWYSVEFWHGEPVKLAACQFDRVG